MQLVQTRIRLGAPFTSAFTACRFTFQRRRVTLCACEMLLPNCGPLPQTSHTCAMVQLQNFRRFVPFCWSQGAFADCTRSTLCRNGSRGSKPCHAEACRTLSIT